MDKLQEMLKRLGYYKGPIDGIHGPLTKEAYYNFAKDKKSIQNFDDFARDIDRNIGVPLNARS